MITTIFAEASKEMSNTSKWENKLYGVNRARNKNFYRIKNEARILDLLHYFGRSWRQWFDESMYTGHNKRGIINKTINMKGKKHGKSNRRRKTLDET